MSLLTGPEIDGSWTTLEAEADYLAELATLPGVTVEELAPSPNGRPIRLVTIGQGTKPSIFATSPHGDEPSGREGLLQWARNLAHSTDPAVTDYLTTHTVTVIPTSNPDGVARSSRLAGNWVDINRDQLALSQPETRNIASTITRYRPHIVVDIHDDVNEETYDTRTVGAKNLMVSGAIRDMSQTLSAHVQAELTGHGRLVTDYPTFSFPSMAGSVAGFRHCLPLLSEVRHLPPPDRALLQVQTLDASLRFHMLHEAEIAAAVEASRQTKRAEGADPVEVDMGDHDTVMVTPDTSYRLHRGQVEQARWHLKIFGIRTQPDPDGATILSAQSAYALIGLLFDPESPHRAITDAPPRTLPAGAIPTGYAIRVGEVAVAPSRVAVNVAGELYTVWEP